MTRVDWTEHARRLREHAADDAQRRTADTGQPHTPDPIVLRIAALCSETAALCPTLPNPALEQLAVRALTTKPARALSHPQP